MTPHSRNFENAATTWDPFIDLNNMHTKFGVHKARFTKQMLKARLDFLQEELDEAYKALEENNADDFVDAHIDLMVVAVGTLDIAGVNGWEAWDNVHSANMAKEIGINSKRPNMGGVDLVKPEGWVKPTHFGNTGKLTEIMLRDEDYKLITPLIEVIRRRALEVLDECKEVMAKKAGDYNAPGSPVKTADYYPRGLDDFWHMLHVKTLRVESLLYLMREGNTVEFEDISQNLKDLIVFSAMMIEFSEGKTDGQNLEKDLFGRSKK